MKLRFVSTRTHGVMDYLGAPLFLAGPRLLDLPAKSVGAKILYGIAGGTLVVSALTDYELGIRRRIPMPVHLAIDAALGVFLLAAPGMFRLRRRARASFQGLGLFELANALATRTRPSYERRGTRMLPNAGARLQEPDWHPAMASTPEPVGSPS
jgi:hypothetical protein